MKRILATLLFLALAPAAALAQSSPGLQYGQVPTAAQWNSYFAAKQDVLGYRPVNSAGDVMTGKLVTAASTTANAGLNFSPGTSPTTPNNGDMWATSLGFFGYIAGNSVQFVTSGVATGTPIVVNLNATSLGLLPSPLTGYVFRGIGTDATLARIELDTFGTGVNPIYSCVAGRGTGAAPTAVQSGDELCTINAWGYTGVATLSATAVAAFRTYAAENFSTGHQGTRAAIATTPSAGTTLTDRIGIENDGGVTLPPAVTGGDEGSGTLNATGLYQAGVHVATLGANTFVGAQTLTINQNAATSFTVNNTTSGTGSIADFDAHNASGDASFGIADAAYTVHPVLAGASFAYANSTPFVVGTTAANPVIIAPNNTEEARILLGLMVGTTTDPGAGIINVLTGYRIGNAAASGNVLRGNGTNFISAQLAAADLSNGTTGSGSVMLATSPTFVTSLIGPLYIGGSAAGATLELRSTSGTGSADAVKITGGTNGGTPLITALGSANQVVIGNTAAPTGLSNVGLFVHAGADQNTGVVAHIALASGNAWFAINDAGNAFEPIEFRGTQFVFNDTLGGGQGVTIGTTTQAGQGNLLVSNSVKAGSFQLSSLLSSTTAPTITAGFCSSPSVSNNNGTARFEVTVGSSCGAGTGTITLPTAAHKWTCFFVDISNPGTHVVRQTGGSATTVTVQDYSGTTGATQNMGSGDVIEAGCGGY